MDNRDNEIRLGQYLFKKMISSNSHEIEIKDLFVYVDEQKYSHGESRYNTDKKEATLDRLTSQIEIIAKMANAYHIKNNSREIATDTGIKHELKNGSENHITRALTVEFFLYTKEPLSFSEFHQLIDRILAISANQNNNVHLLLSSFSIKTDDNQLLNATLYVECGNQPKINMICKRGPAANDRFYQDHYESFEPMVNVGCLHYMPSIDHPLQAKDIENIEFNKIPLFVLANNEIYYVHKDKNIIIPINIDDQPGLIDLIKQELANPPFPISRKNYLIMADSIVKLNKIISPIDRHASTYFADMNGLIVSNHGLFTVHTAGEVGYLQGIEICAEHGSQHLFELLKSYIKIKSTELIPIKTDHILTSNSTYANPQAAISASPIVHIDSEEDRAIAFPDSLTCPDIFSLGNINEFNIKKENNCWKIQNPPFGSSFTIIPAEPRQLKGFSNEFSWDVSKHNEKAILEQTKLLIDKNNTLFFNKANESKNESKPESTTNTNAPDPGANKNVGKI